MSIELLKTETVYQGKAFSIERALVRLPDGNQKVYDLVRHSHAVTLVPVDSEGQVYFVSQYRIGPDQVLLELPAGVLEAGEEPLEGAGRELQEEIGMAASHLEKIGEAYLSPGYSSEYMYFYLATGLYPARLKSDDDEFLEVEAIPIRQVFAMVTSGGIRDGKTLAALLLARPYLEQLLH